MVTKITKLTKKQEEMLPVWTKKWIKIGLKTGETDWNTFEENIKVCYEKANIPFPNKIIRVNSPIVGAFASSIAKKILSYSAVGSAVRSAVDSAVGSAVRSAVGSAVRSAVDSAVDSAVHSAVDSAVDSAVHSAVHSAVRSAVPKLEWHYWFGGQFWVGGWWGSPSFVSFFTDVCNLELEPDILQRTTAYRKICESVNYFWCNKDFVMVCARPSKINLDTLGRLHSEIEKSIEYPDGWGLYHLHGVRFEQELWNKIVKKELLAKQILQLENIEQRSQAMLIFGNENLLKELNARLISKGKPRKFCGSNEEWQSELYELEGVPEKMLKYPDPSTKRIYYSFVPREIKTADEGIGWKFEAKEYEYEIMEVEA